jgi:hypothetical protein
MNVVREILALMTDREFEVVKLSLGGGLLLVFLNRSLEHLKHGLAVRAEFERQRLETARALMAGSRGIFEKVTEIGVNTIKGGFEAAPLLSSELDIALHELMIKAAEAEVFYGPEIKTETSNIQKCAFALKRSSAEFDHSADRREALSEFTARCQPGVEALGEACDSLLRFLRASIAPAGIKKKK